MLPKGEQCGSDLGDRKCAQGTRELDQGKSLNMTISFLFIYLFLTWGERNRSKNDMFRLESVFAGR